LPFMDEAIRLRYPAGEVPTATSGVTLRSLNEAHGWLADQSTWRSGLTKIASYDDYDGDKQKAGWPLDQNVANLYRAFSTYNHDARLDFVFQNEFGDSPSNVSYGSAPEILQLTLNVSAVPDWTKIELLNYSQPVMELTPADYPGSQLALNVPIHYGGVTGFPP
jgi:hypothetical protein